MNKIIPVILAGGSGTRLWPISRKSFPKQFSKLIGKLSLFQQTVLRYHKSQNIKFKNPIIVTNNDFKFIVSQQLEEISVKPRLILIEPSPKNTAPAILSASFFAKNETIIMAPSDHLIDNVDSFHKNINSGLHELEEGNLIIFGVKPNRPETGYGYLRLKKLTEDGPQTVERFIEKPDVNLARKFIGEKRYLWNSGLILFRAKDMLKLFKNINERMHQLIEYCVDNGKLDSNFIRLEKKSWEKCESISIDYAILENIKNLKALELTSGWSDLGDWNSLWREKNKDKNGLNISENITSFDCKDSIFIADNPKQHMVTLGLENLAVVSMTDALLVADKNRSQEIRDVVERLKQNKVVQAENLDKDFRPWGWFESLLNGKNFQVKVIHVKSRESLSLQKHKFRSEHWVVVQGKAKVTINDKTLYLKEGESVYIPLGATHRLENDNEIELILIEVQTGTYLGEDDIIRIEDKYSRHEE